MSVGTTNSYPIIQGFENRLKLKNSSEVKNYLHAQDSSLFGSIRILSRRVFHFILKGVWINDNRVLKEIKMLKATQKTHSIETKIQEIEAINKLFLGKNIEERVVQKMTLKLESTDLPLVSKKLKNPKSNLLNLHFELNEKVKVYFDYNNVRFRLNVSESDMPMLSGLEKSSGQAITLSSNISSKIGKPFFDWMGTQKFESQKLEKEYSHRINMFVKDIQEILVNKGLTIATKVKIDGIYSKNVQSILEPLFDNGSINATVNINKNFNLQISLEKQGSAVNFELKDIVKPDFKFKALSAIAGQTIDANTDLNNIMGSSYFDWATSSGFKEEDIIAGHKARVKALEEDLKPLGLSVKVNNEIDYDTLFQVNGKKALVVSLCEGMGNQMFQAASVYSIAKEHGLDFYCVQKKGIDHQSQMPPVLQKLPFIGVKDLPTLPFMNVWGKNVLNEFPKDKPRSWLIEGHLQSPENFDKDREDILKLFGPSQETRDKLKEKYPEITKPKTIAVHVRRGDYLKKDENGNYYFHNLLEDWKYYEQALKDIGTDDAHVFLFSNDMPFCKNDEAFKHLKNVTFVEGGSASDDISLMSMCNNHVISNGTFAWWGAYLAEDKNTKVFYPNKWIGPAWGDFVPKGLPHPSWTQIDCAQK